MIWRKLGNIFCANNNNNLMLSYARMPTVMHIEDDIYRIYFESRTANNTAYPYYLDIDINEPTKILSLCTTPLLPYGCIGTFDDNGITPFSIVKENDTIRLYYAGWNLDVKVPFHNSIGVAISNDGGRSFRKMFSGPVLARDIYDPYFPTGPFVIKDEDKYKMWYTSFEKWDGEKDNLKHFYNIKYRESCDGIDWRYKPITSISFESDFEYAFVCRSVIKDNDTYKMWYSFRGQHNVETYRIGYAESKDGLNWIRKDDAMTSFDVSKDDWDSEMICYPYVFVHKGQYYMLYNGNGYGKTGFGLAILE